MNDRSGFSAQVYGLFARAVYSAQNAPAGYREVAVKDARLAADLRTADAKVYTDGKQNVVAFAGTQKFGDAATDVAQGLGFRTAKYEAAARIGEAFRSATGTSFTGHSLGGGLAALAGAAASASGAEPKTVVTFNPAGVHRNTFAAAGLDPSSLRSRQTDYTHGSDLLTGLNDLQRMPQVGTRVPVGERGSTAAERIFSRDDARIGHDPETQGMYHAMQAAGAGLQAHKLGSVTQLLPADVAVLQNARNAPVQTQERSHGR